MRCMKIVGKWIRPWPGELLAGLIVAVEGDHVHCVASDGLHFFIPLEVVQRFPLLTGRPTKHHTGARGLN